MALKRSVVGCGNLGATHAACMSSLGFEVIGVDTDPEKILNSTNYFLTNQKLNFPTVFGDGNAASFIAQEIISQFS